MTDQPQNTNQSADNQQQGEKPASFEAWIGTQPDEIKGLYQAHVTGLQNTVKATREEREALRNQLKELQPKAEKGSELEKTLNETLTRLEVAERRAAFIEDATKPEIGCRNPKAAYALATAENLFDRKGNADWQAIKASAPELFGQPSVSANAGSGTQNPPAKAGMNEYIRRAAGRG